MGAEIPYDGLKGSFADWIDNQILEDIHTLLTGKPQADFRVLKERPSQGDFVVAFNPDWFDGYSLTGRSPSLPNLQNSPDNPITASTMDGEQALTMEKLQEIMEQFKEEYKPMRIISGAPLIGPDEVLHHKEDNVFWIGSEAEKKLLALGVPSPAPHSTLAMLRGVEVEPYGPFADHPALWWRHIATGHARCEVADGR